MIEKIEKNKFDKELVPRAIKMNIRGMVFLGYLSAILNLFVAITYSNYVWADVIVCAILASGLLLFQSRICAIALTLLFVVSKIQALIMGNQFSIISLVFLYFYVVGIWSTFRYQKIKNDFYKCNDEPETSFDFMEFNLTQTDEKEDNQVVHGE